MLRLIAAVSEDGVIGVGGELPWRQSEDVRRFKRLTMGCPVIMGRRTFESIDERPLPGRLNIVLSGRAGYERDGVSVARDLDGALVMAGEAAGGGDVFVVGGEGVYRAAIGRADRLDLTIVHTRVGKGDARFPEVDAEAWALVEEERHEADAKNEHAYSFLTYERRRSSRF